MPGMNDTPSLRDNTAESRFELVVAGKTAGQITYSRQAGILVLDHTTIDDEFSGQGLGSKLARGVFTTLADRGETAQLECPFLERWIDKHPEYAGSVIAGREREAG